MVAVTPISRRIIKQAEYEAGRLSLVPAQWAKDFRARFERKAANEGGRNANLWLMDRTEAWRGIRIPLDSTDDEICTLAKRQALEVMGIAHQCAGLADLRQKAGEFCLRWGIDPPAVMVCDKKTGELKGVADRPAIARMTCGQWWRRKLRTVHARNIEAEAIRLGYVHRRREVYASDVTVDRRAQQKARNRKALENTTAHNLTTGQEFTLAELAEKAVSNPAIRRGELMVRLSGFEAVAKGVGDVGMFFTVTCPSRMHPKKTSGKGGVFDNPKYDGTTPREAARYLGKMWSRVRAAWRRRRVAVYGFRIAEPHHDGCPHWHLLLFMAEAVRDMAVSIFARYARAENPEEMGTREARKARFDVKAIDWSKGSACGYLAKYISKNIDGYQVQGDFEGENLDAVTGSRRVEAWATTWGIRQFQQVGGPPVGVWRELRRMEKGATETMEAARSAADVGNWGRYVEVQGGPVVERKHLPLRTAYTRTGERYDAGAGECYPAPATRYGEEAPASIYGVRDVLKDAAGPSRFYRWEIRRGGHGSGQLSGVGENEGGKAVRAALLGGSFCVDVFPAVDASAGVGFVFEVGPDSSAPWSPVNNCTEGRNGKGLGSVGSGGGGEAKVGESPGTYKGDGRGLHGANDRSTGGDRDGID